MYEDIVDFFCRKFLFFCVEVKGTLSRLICFFFDLGRIMSGRGAANCFKAAHSQTGKKEG